MDISMTGTDRDMGRSEEGRTTRAIERQTSRAPSGLYLTLAIASMVASAGLMLSDRAQFGARTLRGRGGIANFIGQWAPTLLIMGVYNKVVKLERELIGNV
jgi:hypothetical protein